MGGVTAERRLYGLFAQLLEYPRGSVAEAARACQVLLAVEHPEAACLVAEFAAMAEAAPPGRLEEIYTGTFDLNATCYPYVGYHLLGESYKRSVLLIGLKQRYRAVGLDTGSELADHVALVLRFLSVLDDADLARELVGEALLPALGRMMRKSEEGGEPPEGEPEGAEPADGREAYHRILHALRLVLEWHAAASHGDRADELTAAAPGAMTTP
jgi:nitrate reductase molybdenum cofactor assembly chaperone